MRIELPLTEGLPDDVHLMSDSQMELISRLMRTVWDGDRLTVTGWGFIRNIDLAANPPEIGLDLVSPDGETRIALETETFDEPRLEVFGGHWHCDYRPGGWRAHVGADQIPADADREWSFELTVVAAGVSRTSRLRERSMAGSSSVPQTHVARGGVTRSVVRGDERQVVVRVTRHPAYAVSQKVTAKGVATVVFRAENPDRVVVNHIDAERRELLTASPEATAKTGEWRVRLDLAALPMPTSNTTSYGVITRPLRVRLRQRDGEFTPILAPPGTSPSPAVIDDPALRRRLTQSKGGELEVMDRVPVATSYAVDEDGVHPPRPLEPAARRLHPAAVQPRPRRAGHADPGGRRGLHARLPAASARAGGTTGCRCRPTGTT